MHALPAPSPRRRPGSPPLRACTFVVGLVLALAAVTPVQAQWRWIGKDGRMNASDLPPPRDIPAKDILERPAQAARAPAADGAASAPAAAAASAAAARTPLDRELEARRRAAEAEKAARAKAEEDRLAAARADNCQRARGQLAALESGQRMARVNEKGEREVLDDQGRADELQRVRGIVASDCR